MDYIAQKPEVEGDCGIACVAMVTGNSYSDSMEKFKHIERPKEFYTRHKDLMQAIDEFGFKARQKRFKSFRDIDGIAIVAVNEKQDGCWHWVVYNGEADPPYIYDPKPEKDGKITDFRGLKGFGNYILITKD